MWTIMSTDIVGEGRRAAGLNVDVQMRPSFVFGDGIRHPLIYSLQQSCWKTRLIWTGKKRRVGARRAIRISRRS